jgi:hypothetical protein
MEDMDTGTGFG